MPPTSLNGIRRYWQSGNRTPLRWIILLTIGFVARGIGWRALAANHVGEPALRWTYVAYLVALDAMLILRGGRDKADYVTTIARRATYPGRRCLCRPAGRPVVGLPGQWRRAGNRGGPAAPCSACRNTRRRWRAS